MRTERRRDEEMKRERATGVTRPVFAFHNYANAPEN
jgi:hypothetical protein